MKDMKENRNTNNMDFVYNYPMIRKIRYIEDKGFMAWIRKLYSLFFFKTFRTFISFSNI